MPRSSYLLVLLWLLAVFIEYSFGCRIKTVNLSFCVSLGCPAPPAWGHLKKLVVWVILPLWIKYDWFKYFIKVTAIQMFFYDYGTYLKKFYNIKVNAFLLEMHVLYVLFLTLIFLIKFVYLYIMYVCCKLLKTILKFLACSGKLVISDCAYWFMYPIKAILWHIYHLSEDDGHYVVIIWQIHILCCLCLKVGLGIHQ